MTSKGWAGHVVASEGNLWFNVTEMGERRRREGKEADKVSKLRAAFTSFKRSINQCVTSHIGYESCAILNVNFLCRKVSGKLHVMYLE